MVQIELFEVTAAIDSDGTLETFYFSSSPAYNHPSAPVNYRTGLKSSGLFKSTIANNLRSLGGSSISTGQTVLTNASGSIDALAHYGYGFPARRLLGDSDSSYNSFTVLVDGIVELVTPAMDQLSFSLRDRQQELDIPYQPSKFGGTNAGVAGIDGTADDILGRAKPRLIGKAFNLTPVPLNTSTLIYGFNFDRAGNTARCLSVTAVRDGGKDLTFGTDRANLAAMQATPPSAGHYDTCLAESLIRLGSKPVYGITLDASTARNQLWQIAGDLLLDAIVPSTRINSDDLAQFALDAPYTAGEYVDYDTTYRQLLDLLVGASGGGFWIPDESGIYRARKLKIPAGDPVVTFRRFGPDVETDANSLDISSMTFMAPSDPGAGVPALRSILTFNHNFTRQIGGSLAASDAAVTAALIAKYGQDSQQDVREPTDDVGVIDISKQFPLAVEIRIDTRLTEAADAAIENTYRLALHGVLRDTIQLEMAFTPAAVAAVRCGNIVAIERARYGYDTGKLFVVTDVEYDKDAGKLVCTLWG